LKTALIFLFSLGVVFSLKAQPVITQQPTNQTVLVGSSVVFSVAVSGSGPFTYQWQFNGTNLPAGIITTVAGNGTQGYSGDNGVATNAELYKPDGVAIDNYGNLFIADYANSRIRKVATNGIITTVAGNGTSGYSGDNGAATNASLIYPVGVAIDNYGNLFIADGNDGIRKVATNGIITTVAGHNGLGYFGDNGAATHAELNVPSGVAIDNNGNLFIADCDNNRIRKVATNGIITTVAGNGTGGYSGDNGAATNASLYRPESVATDNNGNLFIADSVNQRIRKVATNGIITTVAGNGKYGYSGDNGAATNASLYIPYGVAIDNNGSLFIVDYDNNRIRKVATNGIITTVAGNGTGGYSGDNGAATNASLYFPGGVAIDNNGNLFIADRINNRIRKVSSLPSLILSSVSANNVGNYSVVVTSAAGSVTTSNAVLTVIFPAGYNQISGQFISLGSMQFSYVGIAGWKYALDRSVSLSPANWIPQLTNPADANGNLVFTNKPITTTNNFWRIRSVP
jgi:sugar lactone lactonase YvrE